MRTLIMYAIVLQQDAEACAMSTYIIEGSMPPDSDVFVAGGYICRYLCTKGVIMLGWYCRRAFVMVFVRGRWG